MIGGGPGSGLGSGTTVIGRLRRAAQWAALADAVSSAAMQIVHGRGGGVDRPVDPVGRGIGDVTDTRRDGAGHRSGASARGRSGDRAQLGLLAVVEVGDDGAADEHA